MDAPRMIPYYWGLADVHAACFHGVLIVITGLMVTALLLGLSIVLRIEQWLYATTLFLLLPCVGLSVMLPFLLSAQTTPFLQGICLLPLLLFPLSLPIRTLQRDWSATARELGADRQARLRLFWWPLLKNSACASLFLSIFFSIVQ